jgi:pimeloyl-ACP methyl ester carboxylesterase
MRVTLGGQTIGYDDRGRGRPVALLHAFPLDRRMWEPVTRLIEQAVRVVTIDFRGLGDSGGMGSIADGADDLARLLDHLGIERAVVGGVSMGGYGALAFAARHAARMAGLLLVDTRAGADSDEGRAKRDAAIADVARRGTPAFVEGAVPPLLAPDAAQPRDLALAIATLQEPTGIAAALAAMRDRSDRTGELQAIAAPTTVMVGALDTLTPPAEARKLAEVIRGAKLIELPGTGHLVPLEAPGRVADAIVALVGRAAW